MLGAALCISIVSISPFSPYNVYVFTCFLTYMSLWWVFAAALRLLSSCSEWGRSAVFRLLTAVASLPVEHRLQRAWASVVPIPGCRAQAQ